MKHNLPTQYQQFIHLSRYARWVEDQGRRETWEETVDRYVNYMCDKQCAGKIPAEVKAEIREGILKLEVMPSMRCMMTAGKALEIDNIAGYNCSFRAINEISAFDEIMLVLMCLAPDTMIRTESGCKPISKLASMDRVLSRKDNGDYEYVNPSFVGETPSAAKKKIELEFEDGHVVRVTEDHRFLTNRGWVEAKDLNESDEIQNYHEVQ